MRFPTTVGLVFLLAACNNNTWGVDTEVDDTATDDTGVTDTSDTQDTSDTGVTTGLCHPGDPIDLTGWTRSYNVTWEGKTGTEVQTGLGADYTSTGQAAFVTKSELSTADGDHLTTYEYRSCDNNGAGIWHESRVEGEATLDLFGDFGGNVGDFADIIALLTQLLGSSGGGTGTSTALPVNYRQLPTPDVPYLGDQATLQAGGLVSYDYDLMTVGQTADLMTMPNCSSGASPDPDATCVGIDGDLQFLGVESITVAAGTFDAYKVVDSRTERWSEAQAAGGLPDLGDLFPMPGGFFGNTEDQDLISVKYYAPGIGLVKEQTRYATADANDWLIQRELTSHTVPTN